MSRSDRIVDVNRYHLMDVMVGVELVLKSLKTTIDRFFTDVSYEAVSRTTPSPISSVTTANKLYTGYGRCGIKKNYPVR